jgi:histidinol phosphatase-like enzyme (inositol monophosphatase family)
MDPAPNTDPALLAEAVELARMAGEFTLSYFRSRQLVVEAKPDGTPVTAADKGAERLVRAELGRRHPGDGVCGEEEEEKESETGRRWIIDPIDGTQAFTHGVPLYVNLLALEDDYGMAVGVINVPALAETVAAGRGLGCFSNGAPVAVSDRTTLAGSYLCSSGYDYWEEEVLLRVKRAGLQLRTWGDGYGYALVATGRVEAMVDPVAALHDLAPMPVILREAGGRFSDWSGRADPAGGNGLATNGAIHDTLLTLLTAP